MPRYCAVKVCSNRGGSSSKQDNKRLSFYPFPLQDKDRLQRWVDNMQRGAWTPSRHQYLCSEHFTDDCFDIRWGIRYLKSTAVPTVFPSPQEEADSKVTTVKRSLEADAAALDQDFDPAGFDSPLRKKPLILSRTRKEARAVVEHTGTLFETPAVSDAKVLCPSSLSEEETGEVVRPPDYPESSAGGLCRDPLGSDTSVDEHSYCRADTDKDHLWGRILGLHAKLLELDHQEQGTVAKIHQLETEIALLKRDGDTFKEKQKVLEDCLSSVLI